MVWSSTVTRVLYHLTGKGESEARLTLSKLSVFFIFALPQLLTQSLRKTL